MTAFDYVVLLIVGLSVLASVIRGAVRELLALAAWVIAFGVAYLYAPDVAPLLPDGITSQSLRVLASFAGLLLVTLVFMSLVTLAVSGWIKSAGLGFVDRWLGAMFGLARGLLIVLVTVLVAGMTSLPREPFWRNAMFSAPLEAAAMRVKVWLPEDLSKHIRFD